MSFCSLWSHCRFRRQFFLCFWIPLLCDAFYGLFFRTAERFERRECPVVRRRPWQTENHLVLVCVSSRFFSVCLACGVFCGRFMRQDGKLGFVHVLLDKNEQGTRAESQTIFSFCTDPSRFLSQVLACRKQIFFLRGRQVDTPHSFLSLFFK